MPRSQLAVTEGETSLRLQEVTEVMAGAQQFVHAEVASGKLQHLLLKALAGLEDQIANDKVLLPFIHLPLAVYRVIRREEGPARPLAVATTLLFLGIDILDDIADGDLPPHWQGISHAEVQLAAATLLSCLPQLAIARLQVLPQTRARMLACLSEGLLKMSGGQLHDICGAGKNHIRPEDVETSVVHKSGEEGALISMLAAHMAGVSERVAYQYGIFGRALAAGGQIATDCYDIFQSGDSKDFANGSRTLPIVLHLNRLQPSERNFFLAHLDDARRNRASRTLVQRELRSRGVLRLCAFIVEMYCQKARGVLDQLGLTNPERAALERMVDHVSFFPKKEEV